MTIEQQYNAIKAEFISLSKSIHLGYNTYDPLFTVAADAVREVFKAEPIAQGARRKAYNRTNNRLGCSGSYNERTNQYPFPITC
jgi:hypothetical protein